MLCSSCCAVCALCALCALQAEASNVPRATAKEFMEFVRNRQQVTFKPLEDSQVGGQP